jgi:hypothetical protein
VPQIVHRPTVLNDKKRYPFGAVLHKENPCPENQSERFNNPKNRVENLLVAGSILVVRDVFQKFPHTSHFNKSSFFFLRQLFISASRFNASERVGYPSV